MKKLILFLGLFALLLYGCQSPSDSSSVLENSSIEETSSEEISSEDVSSEDVSSEETSSEAAPVEIPEDEPYDLTPLSDEEIANLILPEGYNVADYKDAVFTKEIIAVSFTEDLHKGAGRVHLVISRDGGVTWEDQSVGGDYLYNNVISFSSEKNGYLLVELDYYLGGQSICNAYATHDGGKTWQEITSPNSVCTWKISDVLFTSRNIGFSCHGSFSESVPVFCRTTDGGMSWEKVVLETEEMKNRKASYGHICKAEYKNGIVEFTVEFVDNNAKKESDRIYYSKYVSNDMGQTFEKAE